MHKWTISFKAGWRDFGIFVSAIWINFVLFLLLMMVGSLILFITEIDTGRSWQLQLLDVFYYSITEGVAYNGNAIRLMMVFLMPILTAVIISEGVLRIFSIFMQRGEYKKEWGFMVAKTFQNHVIICGVGEMGQQLFIRLFSENSKDKFILIDPHPDVISSLGVHDQRVIHIQGDMTDVDVLIRANITKADTVILTAGDDTCNLETAYKIIRINHAIPIWIRLHRSGLADLLDLAKKPQVHFFCPFQQAADSVAKEIISERV